MKLFFNKIISQSLQNKPYSLGFTPFIDEKSSWAGLKKLHVQLKKTHIFLRIWFASSLFCYCMDAKLFLIRSSLMNVVTPLGHNTFITKVDNIVKHINNISFFNFLFKTVHFKAIHQVHITSSILPTYFYF